MKKKKNKELKELMKKKKKAKVHYKKVETAMEWSDIEKIENGRVYLKRNDKNCYVIGVKICPRDILIDADYVQKNIINNLRIAFNKIIGKVYFGFVFTPVDIDEHISNLLKEEEKEEDVLRINMIRNDFEKAVWFQETYRELEFCLMIKGEEEKELYKRFDILITELTHAGFKLTEMNNEDFYDYIAYLYENPLINDFYFSRGVFECLLEDDLPSNHVIVHEANFNYDEFYERDGEYDVEQ